MFGNKSKKIARLEERVKNQDNLINNTNHTLTMERERAEALRSRNQELNDILIKKDIAIDQLEERAKKEKQVLAGMLEVFGFDAKKVIKHVEDGEENHVWVFRAMEMLKDFQENQVKRFIQTPVSHLVSQIDPDVLLSVPGYNNPDTEKEFYRHIGFLVMTINGLASDESLGRPKGGTDPE